MQINEEIIRDERITDHDRATDVLMEWAQESMSPEDHQVWDALVTERKSQAAGHVADLIDRNSALISEDNPPASARRTFGNDHK